MLDAAAATALPSHQQDTGPASVSAPTPSGSRQWFVVSTRSKAERRADIHLRQQGYETFLPLVSFSRRDRAVPTMRHRVEIPMFPSYLFIRFDRRDPWRPITNTPGVFQLLTSDGYLPNPVPDAVVSELQAVHALRRSRAPEKTAWAPGMPCCLRKGCAFEGLPAVITAIHINQASIAMMFLGQLRNLSVPIDALVPIGEFQCQDS